MVEIVDDAPERFGARTLAKSVPVTLGPEGQDAAKGQAVSFRQASAQTRAFG